MDVRIHRCRFCGKEYDYHASGPYCHEPVNNENYCPRCMEIINRSLETEVPKEDRYVKKIKEVSEEDIARLLGDDFRTKMEKLKNPDQSGYAAFPRASLILPLPYGHIEAYTISRCRVYVCWNDGEEGRHYYADYLCRMSGLESVDWYYHYDRDTYYPCIGMRSISADKVKPIPFGEISDSIGKILCEMEDFMTNK